MIFMVLVGGLGTFEGPIIGAVIFFLIEYFFGETGVWYLVGLGASAVVFALFLPRGLWGAVEHRFGIRLLPVGYSLRMLRSNFYPGVAAAAAHDQQNGGAPPEATRTRRSIDESKLRISQKRRGKPFVVKNSVPNIVPK